MGGVSSNEYYTFLGVWLLLMNISTDNTILLQFKVQLLLTYTLNGEGMGLGLIVH